MSVKVQSAVLELPTGLCGQKARREGFVGSVAEIGVPQESCEACHPKCLNIYIRENNCSWCWPVDALRMLNTPDRPPELVRSADDEIEIRSEMISTLLTGLGVDPCDWAWTPEAAEAAVKNVLKYIEGDESLWDGNEPGNSIVLAVHDLRKKYRDAHQWARRNLCDSQPCEDCEEASKEFEKKVGDEHVPCPLRKLQSW